jgi:hypothetical protein
MITQRAGGNPDDDAVPGLLREISGQLDTLIQLLSPSEAQQDRDSYIDYQRTWEFEQRDRGL